MARLLIQTNAVTKTPWELNWGITRVGRSPDNDIVLDHPSVSSRHCELELGVDSLVVRDCGSTNGTFVNGQPVKQASLEAGQTLRLGQVTASIEWSRDSVHVPDLVTAKPAASVALGEGVLSCMHHATVPALWQCPKCVRYFCAQCTHDVHLVGRPSRRTCPHCGTPVTLAPWAEARPKKQSLWSRIKRTFNRTARVR
jgi:hypothetical protein